MAEEEANSVFSHEDASSGDEAGRASSAGGPRKRRKEKHLKISYARPATSVLLLRECNTN
jgi:hypothetical protein